jgi:transposase-like protein
VADELRIGLQELLRKAQVEGDANFLKEGVRALSQVIMEMEVEDHVGAARHERSPGRTGQRNGYRRRLWDTRAGALELDVPRVRDSSYFPSLLEPRRRAERALSAVVQEAYVHGVSTRKVDELVKALGMRGISKSRVSKLCAELDEELERFRGRQLEGSYPYVWLDATYVKARQDGRVASMAVVIAVGVNAKSGEREVLGFEVGPSEDGSFWLSFLRSLVARGLSGVRLVTSDAHRGLKGAVAAVLTGASWQRCRVHFERNVLSHVPKSEMSGVAEDLKAIFKVRREKTAQALAEEFVEFYGKRFPKAVAVFEAGIGDALAYLSYPGSHHAKLRTTNMLERLFKEVKRRTRVVGVFPNETSASTLATEIALRSSEGWALRRYLTVDTLEAVEKPNPQLSRH